MAPATKRMSAEEKRQTILNIYHSSKDVFTEKEIISLATKAGVSSGSIVDTNEALVDDNLVSSGKVRGCPLLACLLYLAEKIIFTLFFNASYFILTYLLLASHLAIAQRLGAPSTSGASPPKKTGTGSRSWRS